MSPARLERRLREAAGRIRRERSALRPRSPELARAGRERAMCFWLQGRLDRCWEELRDILGWDEKLRWCSEVLRREWTGAALGGDRLAIHASRGGLGDLIQWSRFVAAVPLGTAALLAECRAPLVRLFERSFGPRIRWLPRSLVEEERDLDSQLYLLPFVLGASFESIAASVPYLGADPAWSEPWLERLAGRPRPWVGLCWRRSAPDEELDDRSCPLALFVPWIEAGRGSFVALSKEDRGEETAAAGLTGRIIETSGGHGDFADTAGLVALLDAVVSIDTSVAHLAGAMGVPTWLLLAEDPFEGWMAGLDPERTPWYPSCRVIRKERPGDWGSSLERVATELRAFLA